ncbi:glutamate--tRNA ligase [Patescibacteria group bacterium]
MDKYKNNQEIRVRIAPSPTGLFHIGTARTALFNYLFAKKNNGKFILRIEDTDKERSNEKYEKDILDNLKWLGLNWDESPSYQSKRTEVYKKYIKQLLDSGQAFWCEHTKEELEREKKEQIDKKEAPKHICDRKGKKGIIRFHCSGKIIFNDLIRGKSEFDGELLGDISIARNEQTPLFLLASTIDDAEMGISHIIRGEDHLSNTPKQILINKALKLNIPQYAHLPLILGNDKSKLSKRHGATSVGDYKKQGYLPEAIVNFIALLGWNPGTEKEIFSAKELIESFSLEKVQKSGAVFDIKKLDWLNGNYIRQMDLDELTEKCFPYLETKDIKYAKKIVALEQERLKKISEIGELTKFFFKEPDYKLELLIWKKMDLKEVKNNLELLLKELSKIDDFEAKSLEGVIMPLTEKSGVGELLWPFRVALSGQKASPGPFEIAEVLGKEKTLKRIKYAIEKL